MSARKLSRSSRSRCVDRAQPCFFRVVAGVDSALLEEVVFDLLEDQRVEVTPRLAPIRCLAGLESNQLDREPGRPGARQYRGGHARDVLLPVEPMLEFVVGKRLGLRIVALGDRLEKRLTRVVAGKALVDDGPADGHAFSSVTSWWPGLGASARNRRNAPVSRCPSGWCSARR